MTSYRVSWVRQKLGSGESIPGKDPRKRLERRSSRSESSWCGTEPTHPASPGRGGLSAYEDERGAPVKMVAVTSLGYCTVVSWGQKTCDQLFTLPLPHMSQRQTPLGSTRVQKE